MKKLQHEKDEKLVRSSGSKYLAVMYIAAELRKRTNKERAEFLANARFRKCKDPYRSLEK